MASYTPAFSLNDKMLILAAQIAEKIGNISSFSNFESKPYLRRNNLIRSVYSSLAIEANSLSLGEVKSVIDGRTVIGPQKEIQEVKNAYEAYSMLGSFDPYSLEDLKKLHGIMTKYILQESGTFRTHNEGVFRGDRCIFMAPPPHLVQEHMQALFNWLCKEKDTIHPLILSCVFHYEFVFIHPFSDGNGRMARLWQTALLAEWNPAFKYMPIESYIHKFQEGYYSAIASCNAKGNSDEFILFMLDKINITLEFAIEQLAQKDANIPATVQKMLDIMEYGTAYSAGELMQKLRLRSRENFRKLYLKPAQNLNLIEMSIPEKPTSRNQTYIKK